MHCTATVHSLAYVVQVGVESENGWRPPDIRPGDPLLTWRTVPGTDVTLQVHAGDIGTVMLAVAAAFNEHIEPLRDADSAAYTDGNSVFTSNHKNATAMDLNWESHAFQTRGTFTPSQQATIRALVDFCEGWIFWAGDWDDPVDEMHWQAGYGTWGRDGELAEFVRRKIGPDGRLIGFTPGAAPTGRDAAIKALYDAVPVIDMARAAQLVDPVMAGLALAQCTTPKRIAMWLAQCGHESDGFATTEEYAKNGRYAPYIGRTWIQITWQSNYAEFGAWAHEQGLLDDPDYFVSRPAALADLKWAGVGAAWYWTVKQPRLNEFADAGNVEDASKAINAPAWIGTPNRANGIEDRIARYNQAIALGGELLALAPADTDQGEETITVADITRAEWDGLVADVKEIRAQLAGDWPQNGNDPKAAAELDKRKAAGDRLTLNDLVVWLKNHASTHKAPTP